jgi:hypothetical protein
MPNITAAGTYGKNSAGLDQLGSPRKRRLYFGGTTVGTQALVQYKNDAGVFQTAENGTITECPKSIIFDGNKELQVVFSGSPNCNLTIE